MQGVEILNTIYKYGSLISPVWILVCAGIVLLICIVGLCTINYDNLQQKLFLAVGVALVGMAVCIALANIPGNKISEIKYQVAISDQVLMTEFYEHYEVIDQDGKIFTVREKTNE